MNTFDFGLIFVFFSLGNWISICSIYFKIDVKRFCMYSGLNLLIIAWDVILKIKSLIKWVKALLTAPDFSNVIYMLIHTAFLWPEIKRLDFASLCNCSLLIMTWREQRQNLVLGGVQCWRIYRTLQHCSLSVLKLLDDRNESNTGSKSL